MKVQSADDVVAKIINDPRFEEEVRANPAEAIAKVAESPLQTDYWIYRIVVIALGLVILTTVIGSISLSNAEKSLSEGIIALASAAVGALAGLLAPSPNQN